MTFEWFRKFITLPAELCQQPEYTGKQKYRKQKKKESFYTSYDNYF